MYIYISHGNLMKPLDFMALLAQTYPVHIPVISWDNLHPECNDSISAQLISDLLGFGREYNQHRYDIYIYIHLIGI